MLGFGGSITCGHNILHPISNGGYSTDLAWTAWLERRLNDHFPCGEKKNNTAQRGAQQQQQQRHVVVNHCKGAAAADYWVDAVASWVHAGEATHRGDPEEEAGRIPGLAEMPGSPWAAAAGATSGSGSGSFDAVVFESAINDVEIAGASCVLCCAVPFLPFCLVDVT